VHPEQKEEKIVRGKIWKGKKAKKKGEKGEKEKKTVGLFTGHCS
jgi:hypothetical protein